jgi:hypothetical protein
MGDDINGQRLPMPLTNEQKSQICGVLAVGCDRRTAADYIGCSLADIRRSMQQDAKFLADVCRVEAQVEVRHMSNVQEMATGEKRDWRASVWWLERRSPERFGRRTAGAITMPQLKAIIAILAESIASDVHDDGDRDRIRRRLKTIADSVEQLLRDAQASCSEGLDSEGFDGDEQVEMAPSNMISNLLGFDGDT